MKLQKILCAQLDALKAEGLENNALERLLAIFEPTLGLGDHLKLW